MIQETTTTTETNAVTTTKALLSFALDENRGLQALTKEDGSIWFVAKDVCDALDHSNSRKALLMLDDDEKGVTKRYTLGGEQEMNIISEPGLYRLIMRSNKPEAKAFQKWVFNEVLPSIRKTGGYMDPARMEALTRQIVSSVSDQVRAGSSITSPIGLFVRDRCSVQPGNIIIKQELYEAYETHCILNGTIPLARTQFFNSLYLTFAGVKNTRRSIGNTRIPCVSGIRLNREGGRS